VYRANGFLAKRFIEHDVGKSLHRSLHKELSVLQEFLMCLQGSSSGFYGDNAREKFHRLKVKVNGAAGSLNASIMIFQGIKNGPNPEYFSENKQKLLTLLENIQ
jgi:hypothetical protein